MRLEKYLRQIIARNPSLAATLAGNDVDNSTIELNNGQMRVKDAGIAAAKLASGAAVTNLAAGSVGLSKLATATKPILHVVAAGTFTTAGGDANESITAAGVVGTDSAVVWVQKAGATPRTVDSATPGTGAIAVVMSDDPSTDHVLGYIVTRPAA